MAILIALAARVEARGQLPCSYTVTIIPNEPCFGGPANPRAINNLGHVLLTANCFEAYDETYIWTGGPALTLIPRPAGMLGFTGNDINDNDVICGEAWFSGSIGLRGVVYDHGQWAILPPLDPPLGWSSAEAINNNGQVCGYRSIGSKSDPVNPTTAFTWSPLNGGTFTDLGAMGRVGSAAYDINMAGASVVADSAIAGAFAFVWQTGELLPIGPMPDASTPFPRHINSGGTVGGSAVLSSANSQPFIWRDGKATLLGTLPGHVRGGVGGINDDDLVTGLNAQPNSVSHAYVWKDGVLRALQDLVNQPGITIRRSTGINNAGLIIADGRFNNTNFTLLLTPRPRIIGDANCDEHVNVDDLLQVITSWGPCAGCGADFDGNAIINSWDLIQVLIHWAG